MRKTDGYGPMEPFRLEGQWWVPERPQRRYVGGVLEYSLDDGLELRLFDALDPPDDHRGGTFDWSNAPSPPVIHGRTFGGPTDLTLLGAFGGVPELPSTSTTYQSQSFRLQWALMGVHIDDPNPSFSRCWLSISGAEKWMGSSGLRQPRFEGRPPTSVDIRWQRPEPVEVNLEDGLVLSLRWEPHPSGDEHQYGEVRPSPSFQSRSNAPRSLESWLREVGGPLRDLSSLLVQAPMHVVSFAVEPDTTGNAVHSLPAEVVYHAHRPLDDRAAAFALVEADHDQLAALVFRWFTMYRDPVTRIALSRFFSAGYRESYVEQRVSDIAAILEVMPPAQGDLPRLVSEDVVEFLVAAFESIANAASLEGQVRAALTARLRSVADPTFKQRVESLVAEVSDAVSTLVRTPARFASNLRDVRNPLAHGAALPVDPEEAFWLARAGRFILTAVLLARLGVEQDRIARALSALPAYRHACQVCSQFSWGANITGA